ncbi:ribosomal protein S18-alanine N-acetyltransferase [Tetragenococcus koreensis]|uniref:Ribosomal-protein-alanine acetyltransferase n=1 Tax=Tetragenococcus koreensis TaxID=290335 RepID=A0AAN4RJV2_9ENTE|nr:ribosomal protein S18-alanine N-acetyltransferase [Tetragenococcus koreensis]MCF1616250.1 ribosomal protein S18-alanine N-acetyltransferase [Tetragenococcus koreensis]MCF1620954.1 ribosomal protein S18-alanine N-acetyltransferase [Tetragenococcus koreensis]MCF1626114.1 ribosomal protein S18-alanine N-acetyltransferase [Tetragenococcus koreensis]MCF1631150.1 ribosomal protein S18-alanine N-acetyltransferase [Tetragenococcus koreensis]MCF1677083.1 ribosomal protein S18-alanine N-acetyltransfe
MLKRFRSAISAFHHKERYITHEQEIADKKFIVREMSTNDIKELLQLEKVIYAGELPWARSAFLAELYSRYVHLYLCILYQDQIVGFVGIRLFFDDAHITHVAVHPNFQKTGIGSLLIKEVEAFAYRQHCQTISLEVRISNIDAKRLYRKLGYETKKRMTQYYKIGNEDALYMVKKVE